MNRTLAGKPPAVHRLYQRLLPLATLLSRLCAALLAGHVIASAGNLLLASWLPMPAVEALLTDILLHLLAPGLALIWTLSAPSARRAWLGALLPAVFTASLAAIVG